MRYELSGETITFYLTRGINMQENEIRVGDTVEIRLEGVVNYLNGDGTPDVTVKDVAGLVADEDGENDVDVQCVPLKCVTLTRRALNVGDLLTTQSEYNEAPLGTVVGSLDGTLVKVAGGWIDPRTPGQEPYRSLCIPRPVQYVPAD